MYICDVYNAGETILIIICVPSKMALGGINIRRDGDLGYGREVKCVKKKKKWGIGKVLHPFKK